MEGTDVVIVNGHIFVLVIFQYFARISWIGIKQIPGQKTVTNVTHFHTTFAENAREVV